MSMYNKSMIMIFKYVIIMHNIYLNVILPHFNKENIHIQPNLTHTYLNIYIFYNIVAYTDKTEFLL